MGLLKESKDDCILSLKVTYGTSMVNCIADYFNESTFSTLNIYTNIQENKTDKLLGEKTL